MTRSFLDSLQCVLLRSSKILDPIRELHVSALILIDTFWIVSPFARNIPFHCPLFHVCATNSLIRSLAHSPMLLMWFWMLRIFAGSTMWSPLKVRHMLLIGVTTGTHLCAFHRVQMHEDRPPYTSKQHGSTAGCLRC